MTTPATRSSVSITVDFGDRNGSIDWATCKRLDRTTIRIVNDPALGGIYVEQDTFPARGPVGYDVLANDCTRASALEVANAKIAALVALGGKIVKRETRA